MKTLLYTTCVLLGFAALLLPTLGCGGGGGGGSTPVLGQPTLLATQIRWIDVVPADGVVNSGDQLIFKFDKNVTVTTPPPHNGDLVPTAGGLVGGAGSMWTDGPAGDEMTYTVGAAPVNLVPGVGLGSHQLNIVNAANGIFNSADLPAGAALAAGAPVEIMPNPGLSTQFIGSGTSQAIASGIFDVDGWREILIGKNGPNEVFDATALGVYAAAPAIGGDPGLNTRGVALGYFNPGLDLDFVTANGGGGGQANYVYLGGPNATFANVPLANQTVLGTSDSYDIAVSDDLLTGPIESWQGGGICDIVVANNGPNYVYFGDGLGFFDGLPAPGNVTMPLTPDRLTVPGGGGDSRALVVGNIDNAGLRDFVHVDDALGGPGVITSTTVTAGPVFTPQLIGPGLPNPRSVAIINADGDVWNDVLVGYEGSGGMQLIRQTASGVWQAPITFAGGSVYALAVVDINLDGIMDVVQGRANGQSDRIFIGLGAAPWFVDSGLELGNESTMDLAVDFFGGWAGQWDIASASVTPNRLWIFGQP